jgi:hypothetical protein
MWKKAAGSISGGGFSQHIFQSCADVTETVIRATQSER